MPLERDTEDLGIVRLCRFCGEEWPRDPEFWYITANGKVVGRCRACWVDFNKSRRWRYPRKTA